MKAGLDALYTRNDPTAASIQFRGVLAQDPEHYGATYQLGVALDRAGRHAEARAHWERMLVLAKAANDERTIATVVARLERVDVVSDQAIMQRGLDALYRAGDARAAAAEFTKVLARNPEHYGATYQLATALDRLGQSAEARPLWEKVLAMAEGYHDNVTADTARARLMRRH